MYRRDRKALSYPEEGAAFFEPERLTPPVGMIPPRTMGINTRLITRGFGASETTEAPSLFSTPTPWLAAAAGAIGGFILWRHK